jgi:outer membrane cobalamin receptor
VFPRHRREPYRVAEFPGNATVITPEEIARSGATSLPELLGRYEGVTVMDTNGFGLGADGSVNLRGVVNSSRTNALVFVCGVLTFGVRFVRDNVTTHFKIENLTNEEYTSFQSS